MVEKARSLLATARFPNVPSVVSNVGLGILIASSSGGEVFAGNILGAMLAGVLLYIGGNFFNDWYDREWDARHRPERALPRRLFNPGFYLTLAVILVCGGLMLGIWIGSGLPVCMLILLIALYTRFHKQTKWAVIAMGLCRAMLLWLGAASVSHSGNDGLLIFAMLALFCYIAGISLSARYETMENPHAGAMLCARGLLIGAGLLNAGQVGFHPSILAYFIWLGMALTVFRRPLSRQVSALLAGIPLLDWVIAFPLSSGGQLWPMDYWTAGFWIAPLAFLSALLLQRLAPAT